jgi:heptosyltransferase-2
LNSIPTHHPSPISSHGEIRRLLVRAPNWMGDAVMCEPALRGLRALFPSVEISVLAKPMVAELLGSQPEIDRVVVYDDKKSHAGLSGKWTLAGALRRQRYDLALLFQNAFEAALLAWLAGIPRRYGYVTDGRAVLLTDPVAVPDQAKLTHHVHYYWDLLKPLGLSGDPPAPQLAIAPEEERTIAGRLSENGVAASDAVVGINPGSTYGGAKRWMPERFADTAERLCVDIERTTGRGASVVILGGKGEEELGYAVAERMTRRTVVLSGRTTVRELMAAVKRCALLVTNDTGPMHVAAAVGVPVVAIFGPTDWRTTAPFGQEAGIVRQPVECAPCLLRECPIDHRCMTRVSVDQVYGVAVKQLGGLSGLSRLSGRSGGGDAFHKTDRIDQTDHTTVLSGFTIFLDRDGTLNPDPGYIRSPDQLECFPDVPRALAALKAAGAKLVVVTNQSGVARGMFSLEELNAVHDKLRRLLGEAGAPLDAIYVCPHHPDEGCRCRKPATGMIDQAVADLGVDLSRAYVIGDQERDALLAGRVGAKGVLVMTGERGTEALRELESAGRPPDAVAASLSEAAEWILADACARFPSSDGQRVS